MSKPTAFWASDLQATTLPGILTVVMETWLKQICRFQLIWRLPRRMTVTRNALGKHAEYNLICT